VPADTAFRASPTRMKAMVFAVVVWESNDGARVFVSATRMKQGFSQCGDGSARQGVLYDGRGRDVERGGTSTVAHQVRLTVRKKRNDADMCRLPSLGGAGEVFTKS
jgi:hypothetical protein